MCPQLLIIVGAYWLNILYRKYQRYSKRCRFDAKTRAVIMKYRDFDLTINQSCSGLSVVNRSNKLALEKQLTNVSMALSYEVKHKYGQMSSYSEANHLIRRKWAQKRLAEINPKIRSKDAYIILQRCEFYYNISLEDEIEEMEWTDSYQKSSFNSAH